jgi:hypothetical protein
MNDSPGAPLIFRLDNALPVTMRRGSSMSSGTFNGVILRRFASQQIAARQGY